MGRKRLAMGTLSGCLAVSSLAAAERSIADAMSDKSTGGDGIIDSCLVLRTQAKELSQQLASCDAMPLSDEGTGRREERSSALRQCLLTAAAILRCGAALEDEESSYFDRQAAVTLEHALANSVGSSQDKRRARRRFAEFRAAVARRGLRFALVSQGGISLGSWQAGFATVLTDWVKAVRARGFDPASRARGFTAVTGASAGAVNGLAVALSSCREGSQRPVDTLAYKVWVESLGLTGRHGYPGLWSSKDPPRQALALLDERAIREVAMKHAREALGESFTPGCHVDFGFSVTPLGVQTKDVHVEEQRSSAPPVSLIRRSSLREKFALSFSSDASGTIEVRNVTLPEPSREQRYFFARLGLQPEGAAIDRDVVLRAVQASGAFPGAFPPVRLPYVERHPTLKEVVKVAAFVDGGTFDNTPIGLAVDLTEWQHARTNEQKVVPLQDNPFLSGVLRSQPINYYFLEPNVTAWANQSREVPPDGVATEDIVRTLLRFGGNFIASSFDAEFLDNARRYPFILRANQDWSAPRLVVPERQMPIAGEQLAHFFAFFEHDFRVYDFYVGMADARHFLAREERQLAIAGEQSLLEKLEQTWSKDVRYRCIVDYYDAVMRRSDSAPAVGTQGAGKEVEPAIDWGTPLRDPTALPTTCRRLWRPEQSDAVLSDFRKQVRGALGGAHRERFDADLANPVATSNFAAMLAAMHNYRVWLTREQPAEPSFARFVASLNGDRLDGSEPASDPWFRYVDLRTIDSAGDAIEVVWDTLHEAIQNLARNQKAEVTPHLLRIAERPALDAMFDTKTWPQVSLGVGLSHGVEVYGGWRLYRALRGDLGTRLLRFRAPLGQPPWVNERFSSSEAFVRLTLQDFMPLGFGAALDSYLRLGVGCLNLGHCQQNEDDGLFVSPGIGIRISLLDRLSLGLEYQRPWLWGRPLRSGWSQLPTSIVFQFLW